MSEINFDRAERLADWALAKGHTILELAFAWLLARPAVASVIAGATSPAQVAANVATADWVLEPDEVSEVTALTG